MSLGYWLPNKKGGVAMFEHLPVITEENFRGMAEKELDSLFGLVKRCAERTEMLDEMVDCIFEELGWVDPWLVSGVKRAAYGVVEMMKTRGNVEPVMAGIAGISTIQGVLFVLRLIDRALETKELEQRSGEGV